MSGASASLFIVDRIGNITVTSPTFDADKLRTSPQQFRDATVTYTGKVAARAVDLAGQGVDWTVPHAQTMLSSAIGYTIPMIENVAARAQAAATQAGPAIGSAREHLVSGYLSCVSLATNQVDVALSARGLLSKRARRTPEVPAIALTTPTCKRRECHTLRVFGLTALVGAVAGMSYILWKRSQPIEDPQAEKYWADLDMDFFVPNTKAEEATFEAGE